MPQIKPSIKNIFNPLKFAIQLQHYLYTLKVEQVIGDIPNIIYYFCKPAFTINENFEVTEHFYNVVYRHFGGEQVTISISTHYSTALWLKVIFFYCTLRLANIVKVENDDYKDQEFLDNATGPVTKDEFMAGYKEFFEQNNIK